MTFKRPVQQLEAAREAAKRYAETPQDVQAQMREAILHLCDAMEDLRFPLVVAQTEPAQMYANGLASREWSQLNAAERLYSVRREQDGDFVTLDGVFVDELLGVIGTGR